MAVVYLALGANLGDRAENMRHALTQIERFARVLAVSSLYETDPDPPGQPLYYNAAAKVETGLEPLPLLRRLKEIERSLGRRAPGKRNAPRPIDLDILLYDNLVLESDTLEVPHPRMRQRAFVLAPLAEIAADAMHPVERRTVAELSEAAGNEGVRLVQDAGWEKAKG